MNGNSVIYLLFFVLIFDPGWSFGQMGNIDHYLPVIPSLSLSVKDTIRPGNLKINPIKIFFNEISLSYEQFRKISWIKPGASDLTGIDSIITKRKAERKSSINYIVGFIYPSDINHLIEYKDQIHYTCVKYLDDAGISPFINWGLSLKLDLRRYRNTFYHGPEFMEKFVFYPKTVVDNQSGSLEEGLVRLQSGYANILGFGYFIGFQKEYRRLVTDFFFGAGVRYRSAIRKIWEEQNYMGPKVIFAEPKTENLNRGYPALNLGVRLGFTL